MTTPDTSLLETLSQAAHEAWIDSKLAQGMKSRQSEWGEELMVPYATLSEQAKDLDRGTVRGVLAAVDLAGFVVVPVQVLGAVRAQAARAIAGSGPRTKERRLAEYVHRTLPDPGTGGDRDG